MHPWWPPSSARLIVEPKVYGHSWRSLPKPMLAWGWQSWSTPAWKNDKLLRGKSPELCSHFISQSFKGAVPDECARNVHGWLNFLRQISEPSRRLSSYVGQNDFKICQLKREMTEGSKLVFSLDWCTLEPQVNVAAMQETHFTNAEDCRVLEGEFVVFLVFDSRCSAGGLSASWTQP